MRRPPLSPSAAARRIMARAGFNNGGVFALYLAMAAPFPGRNALGVPLRWTQVPQASSDAGMRTVEDIENKWQLASTTMKALGVKMGSRLRALHTARRYHLHGAFPYHHNLGFWIWIWICMTSPILFILGE